MMFNFKKFFSIALLAMMVMGGFSNTAFAVIDTTPPVITLNGFASYSLTQFSPYIEMGAFATDNVDGDLTGSVTKTYSPNPATVDTSVLGVNTVTYNVSDAAGNPAIPVVRTVTIVANPLPTDLAYLLISPDGNTIIAGQSQTFTAQGFDSLNNSLGDVTAGTTFSMAPLEGGASIPCVGAVCTPPTPGVWTITGTNGSASGIAFLTVNPAALVSLAITPATATILAGNTQAYTAIATDEIGNTIDVTASTTFTVVEGGAHGSCTGSTCTAQTVGTWTVAGSYSTVSNTASLTVTPNVLYRLIVSPDGAVITVGTSQAFTAQGLDQYDNSLGDVTAGTTFSMAPLEGGASIPCVGAVCTPPTPGNWTITGTNGSATGVAFLTVNPGPLTTIIVSPATATISAGQSQTYTAQGFDQFNNSLGDVTASTVFTIQAGANGSCTGSTCTAQTVGTWTITGTNGSATGVAFLTVNPGPLTTIIVSPATATISAGQSQTYTAQGFDQFNNSLGDVTASTVFTIQAGANGSCTGSTCTAQTVGTWTVTGTNGAATATASLTVTPGALFSIVITPATATIVVGDSQIFSVQGFDQFNNSLGNVTAATVFTIQAGANGACSGPACTAQTVGTWIVTGTNGAVTGTANLIVITRPEINAPVLSNVSATPGQYSATINFTSDQTGTAKTLYGITSSYGFTTDYLVMTVGANAITLGGLDCNTLYHYKVYGKNSAGLESSSTDLTFTTTACPAGPSIPVLALNTPVPSQYAAAINFTSDQTGTAKVIYGTTNSYGFTTDYLSMTIGANTINLGGLDCNTLYHYKVYGKNSAGLEVGTADGTFTTTACPAGPTVPVLTLGTPTPSQYSAIINFTSDQTGTAFAIYGKTNAYGFISDTISMVVPDNNITLGSLDCNTLYHYKVYGKNSAGLEVGTADGTFITTACPPNPVAPVLSNISAIPGQYSADINFTSDQTGNFKVVYGIPTTYGLSTDYSDAMVIGTNTITLGNLDCNSTYNFKVYAKNSFNLETASTNYTFTTTACPPTAPTVVIISPIGGAIVSGIIDIVASNADQYQIDGGAWVSIVTPWDTTAIPNGSHSIRAMGGTPTGFSDQITVIVNNGNVPTFVWNSPVPGSTLPYTTTIDSTYTITNFNTGSVEYNINGGAWLPAGDSAQANIPVQVGTNTLQLRATKTIDSVATTGYSAINTFTISPEQDTSLPVVISQYPLPGATDVSIDVRPYLEFSEIIDSTTAGPDNIKLCLVSDTTCANPIDVGFNLVPAGGTRVYIGSSNLLLDYGTGYWITASGVKDLAGNIMDGIYGDVNSGFTTIAEPTGELSADQPVMTKMTGVADNTYANGWEFVVRITLPITERGLALRFNNWTSGSNTIAAANNMQYYSEQISSGLGSSTNPVLITSNNFPANDIVILNDADPSRAGIQTDIHIQIKIPTSTPGGSYSNNYRIRSSAAI